MVELQLILRLPDSPRLFQLHHSFKVASSLSLYSKNFLEHAELIDSDGKEQEITFLNWVIGFYFWNSFDPPHPASCQDGGVSHFNFE